MIYKCKNGTYTVVGTDNCQWGGPDGGWKVPDPTMGGSVVLERTEDGKIFFLFYHCAKGEWVARGTRGGKIDGSKAVTL
jgi:hypothetical protein